MKLLAIALTLLSSFAAQPYQPCTAFNPNDLLQSGVVQFVNKEKSKTSCFTVKIDFKIPKSGISTAVSTNDLEKYRPKTGLDYSVRGGRKGDTNNLALSLLVGDDSWTKISVSYLVSARTDLYLGSFIADTFSLFGCDSSKTDNGLISYGVNGLPQQKKGFNVQLFISGIKTDDGSVSVSIWEAAVDSSGLLTFNVRSNANPSIENLHISYVIWSKTSFNIFTFSDRPSEANYELIGVTQFKRSKSEFLGLGIQFDRLNCVGGGCKKDCVSDHECQKFGGVKVDKDCHICGKKEKFWKNKCVPNCGLFEIFQDGKCVCKDGYIRLGYQCKYRCGVNQKWQNGKCVCISEHAKIDGVCRSCPENSWAASDGSRCICKKGFLWNKKTRLCDPIVCPPYSTLSWKDGIHECKCNKGYLWWKNKCVPNCGKKQTFKNGECVCIQDHVRIDGICTQCPPGSWASADGKECVCKKNFHWNPRKNSCDELICKDGAEVKFFGDKFRCECKKGFRYYYGKCEPIIECPPRSIWNQKRLECQCTQEGEYLIRNKCQPCGLNEGWNGEKCVCRTGYFKINNVCRVCDPNTFYNGIDCICNHGYYGNADKCEKCHESCGKCSGPHANQCLSCSDVSYDLKDGYCKRKSPCPTGLFLDGKQCKPCSAYCAECTSENVCKKCINGFKLESLQFYGKKASFCSQICGDGKRFEVDCDDGNLSPGDGCNENCEVEKGFTCQGGSSVKPSNCVSFAPSRSFLAMKGTVHLFGKVVQGVRMTYIPPELTKNDCAECSKLIWARVIDSEVVPGVRIKYLPGSKYQFLAEFEFHGLFAIPLFSVSFQINPDFRKYFSEADMAQIKIKTIDPALLVRINKSSEEELSLDEITNDRGVSNEALSKIFGSD